MAFKNQAETMTVAGKVTGVDQEAGTFTLRCRSGDDVVVNVGVTTYYEVMSNVDGVPRDRTQAPPDDGGNPGKAGLARYLAEDALVFARGNHMEADGKERFDGRTIFVLKSSPDSKYGFEETHWWIDQISRLADRWLDQLMSGDRNYTSEDWARAYRTQRNAVGQAGDDTTQECATLSRLIYGLSSAYLMTGTDRYFDAAKAAVDYQRQAFRSLSHDGRHCFWAFGRRSGSGGEKLLVASEFGDDYGAIPLYEQIYALAGLAQFYRISADWAALDDIRRTVRTFFDFYRDDEAAKERGLPGYGGYFSHLDPVTRRPDVPALGDNASRKNWNSVGDHIPAYLVNLILGLDPLPRRASRQELDALQDESIGLLEETVTLIIEKFPDESSDYVNERFHADWTPDHAYKWQQNRAVVGHNLKIAWNLTRCSFYLDRRVQDLTSHGRRDEAERNKRLSERCIELATELGDRMAEIGAVDPVRGGIFDSVEREPGNGMPIEFSWGTTKDFWQQEQAILAYLILHGATQEERYLDLARECSAFWNLFFLDRDNQGIYFRTDEDGSPITEGMFGGKGGHSVSGYHAFELNYLAHLYTRAYVDAGGTGRFSLHFKLLDSRGQDTINVLPDFMPVNKVEIASVFVDGVDYTDSLKPDDPNNFQIAVDDLTASARDGAIDLMVEFAVH
ncbi:AGE family epimerase/isomerase [Actinomadura fibrosa]|uniref:AGE family epimerase/isomerase n=1 Tax=Actinomadura fibrosa TaxID=111802 RepID=A0ABW2XDY7_9ACTN|nr:AGE family epimerase/isomerase [Actinomadura fibrosa]